MSARHQNNVTTRLRNLQAVKNFENLRALSIYRATSAFNISPQPRKSMAIWQHHSPSRQTSNRSRPWRTNRRWSCSPPRSRHRIGHVSRARLIPESSASGLATKIAITGNCRGRRSNASQIENELMLPEAPVPAPSFSAASLDVIG